MSDKIICMKTFIIGAVSALALVASVAPALAAAQTVVWPYSTLTLVAPTLVTQTTSNFSAVQSNTIAAPVISGATQTLTSAVNYYPAALLAPNTTITQAANSVSLTNTNTLAGQTTILGTQTAKSGVNVIY